MQKAFIAASQSRIVSFAADYKFKFSAAELTTVADEFKARTDKLREELNALREEELETVVGGTSATSAASSMATLKSDKIFNRMGEVFDALGATASGGG